MKTSVLICHPAKAGDPGNTDLRSARFSLPVFLGTGTTPKNRSQYTNSISPEFGQVRNEIIYSDRHGISTYLFRMLGLMRLRTGVRGKRAPYSGSPSTIDCRHVASRSRTATIFA